MRKSGFVKKCVYVRFPIRRAKQPPPSTTTLATYIYIYTHTHTYVRRKGIMEMGLMGVPRVGDGMQTQINPVRLGRRVHGMVLIVHLIVVVTVTIVRGRFGGSGGRPR